MSFIYINPKNPTTLRSVRKARPYFDGYVALVIRILCDAASTARGYVHLANDAHSYAEQVIEARLWLEQCADEFIAPLIAMGYSLPPVMADWVREHESEWPVPDAARRPDGCTALARAADRATREYSGFATSSSQWIALVRQHGANNRGRRRRPAPSHE